MSKTAGLLVLLVLCATISALYTIWIRRRELQRDTRFGTRERFEFPNWYDRFYGDSGYDPMVVKGVLDALASQIRADPTQFRPDDRLDEDLSYGPKSLLVDDPLELFYTGIVALVKKKGAKWNPFPNMQTLDDVVRSVVESVSDAARD